MIRNAIPFDPRTAAAFRAIRETEAFLEECSRHPESIRRIPVIRVGCGAFSPQLSREFWSEALGLEAA